MKLSEKIKLLGQIPRLLRSFLPRNDDNRSVIANSEERGVKQSHTSYIAGASVLENDYSFRLDTIVSTAWRQFDSQFSTHCVGNSKSVEISPICTICVL